MYGTSGQATSNNRSLYDLLWDQYSASENYHGQRFVCMDTVVRELTYDQISQWIERHPPQQLSEPRVNLPNLIGIILKDSRLLFAMLVLGRLEHLLSKLVSHGFSDNTLFDTTSFEEGCMSAQLTERQRRTMVDYRMRIGAVLRNDRHQVFQRDIVLPYRKVNHPRDDRFGGYGVVRRVEVAAGHLRGYNETIVAMKQVRPMNNESKDEWNQLYREVETLQRMRHPNIVPLLASYYLDSTDSSNRSFTTMYLLFPWADMDLETWMTSSTVPKPLENLSRRERRAYLYRSMYALLSGLSYLHQESDGFVTSHHDLKPSNILVIGQDFKIADLGRSHLRPADGGSETEGTNGLGTYEYQPPEYWQQNGSRAKIRHGRAFDIWAMGCVLVELATLIVHDWETLQVLNFREKRASNLTPDRPKLAESRNPVDSSFHNNWSIVQDWVVQLKQHPRGSETLEDMLDIAMGMLDHNPSSRPYAWETKIDLHNIQNPSQSASIEEALSVQSPSKSHYQGQVLNGAQTPLHRAALKADSKRLTDLLSLGWPMFVQDQKGETALDIVRRNADKAFRESFSLYLGHGNAATLTNRGIALLKAAEAGDTVTLTDLLDSGVDPLLVDSQGHSALFLAVQQGHIHGIDVLLQSKITDQLLLKERAGGNTALQEAVVKGRKHIVNKLLEFSPYLEDRQREGKTALFLAVESNLNEAVEILLDCAPRAQVFTQSNTGDTPLHRATTLNIELLELILSAEDSAKCLEHHNQFGETPIWLALRNENFEGFQLLKERGVSLSVANNDNDNLLHLVAKFGLYEFLNQNLAVFDASDIEQRNRWNDTPLTIADRGGNSDLAGLLRSFYNGKIIPNAVEPIHSNSPKLFYTLGSESKWMREGTQRYWRHLTYESYQVYSEIYKLAADGQRVVQFTDFVKQFNPNDPRPETI